MSDAIRIIGLVLNKIHGIREIQLCAPVDQYGIMKLSENTKHDGNTYTWHPIGAHAQCGSESPVAKGQERNDKGKKNLSAQIHVIRQQYRGQWEDNLNHQQYKTARPSCESYTCV